MKVKHLVILIVFLLVVLEILRKNKNKKQSIQLIKNNLYSELKTKNDKNQKKINELEELLRKEQRWSFYLSVFTVLSICGLSIYIYMLIIKRKKLSIEHFDYYREMNRIFLNTKYPFRYRHEHRDYQFNIAVSDDARILSNRISNNLQLTDTYEQHVKNQIRKFQLEKAIHYLRVV